MPSGISTESENGFGDNNTISTQKNNYIVVYPSGSHHEITLGLNGIHQSSPTTKNCSFGNREQKYDKSEGEKLEDAKTDKEPAVAIRRPTATAKPQVGQKNRQWNLANLLEMTEICCLWEKLDLATTVISSGVQAIA